MTIHFHEEKNRKSYAVRTASRDWLDAFQKWVTPAGKTVIDLGCGGGIYSKAWAELGVARVIGVDFSEVMLQAAEENCKGYDNIAFWQGDALGTRLPDGCADIVFCRAVIHHLSDLGPFFSEAKRLLVPGGVCIVQDRTLEDVMLPGSPEHLRGYFFSCFPRLLDVEAARRPQLEAVCRHMAGSGLQMVQAHSLWETRREYNDFAQLAEDLAERTGRSILHELSDAELNDLIAEIKREVGDQHPIREKDRWTVWTGITT
ncbi:class I SAM-dependent methyltransferase [Brevibacillus sp. H7]|uniref:class I SAM-dependent methyltransferase n=1 Tax=Brevibacillus sp. H7 TaxID=3349138 RepID=UPI00382EE5FA